MDGGKSQSIKITVASAMQAALYGLWPVLLIYTITLGDYAPEQLFEPVLFVCTMNLALWALLCAMKLGAARAAFIVSTLCLANFFYLPFSEVLSLPAKLFPVPVPDSVVLGWYSLLLLGILVVLGLGEIRLGSKVIKINFQAMVLPAVVIAAALCMINIFSIAASEAKSNEIAKQISRQYFPVDQKLIVGKDTLKPDIYYVVIDGFASSATLKDLLGYDNSDFINYLKQNNFYVAERSVSNHDRTIFSVTSSLNMGFITPLAEFLPENSANSNVPLKLLRDNRVMKLFKRAGYRIINVCSGFCATDYIPQADQNLRSGWGTGFNMSLLHISMLGAFEPYVHIVEDEYANVRTAPMHRASEIANLPGPKFVLIHCLLTHPPFIFDEAGKLRPLSKQLLSAPFVKDLYIDQLKFTQKKLKELLNVLCQANDGNSLVLLQSDHGSACTDWLNSSLFSIERMRILNAYRVPDRMKAALYPTISPVNSFRIVLNDLFGAGLPLQKDESFIAIPPGEWSNFQNVTELLSKSWK